MRAPTNLDVIKEGTTRLAHGAFDQLFRLTSDACIITTRAGRFIAGNAAAQALIGTPDDALFGRSLTAFVDRDERIRLRKYISEVASDQTLSDSSWTIRGVDDSPFDVRARVVHLSTDDDGILLLWMFRPAARVERHRYFDATPADTARA